jgi:LemA protein
MNEQTMLIVCGLIAVSVLVLLILWVIGLTKLTELNGQINLTVGTLAAQYQQRLDLIPDTVKLAREAVHRQKKYFDKLLEIRKGMHPGLTTSSLGSLPPDDLPIVIAALSAAASKACHESNPNMDVSVYAEALRTMKETEMDIAGARRFFWSAVTDYNIAVRSLPFSIIAKVHGYRLMPEAQIPAGMEKKPAYF